REELALSAELPGSAGAAWERLLQAPTATTWFPLRGPLAAGQAIFRAGDGEQPDAFLVGDLEVDARHHALSFTLQPCAEEAMPAPAALPGSAHAPAVRQQSMSMDRQQPPTAQSHSSADAAAPAPPRDGAAQAWLHPTACRLALRPRAESALLTIRHVGWEGIGFERAARLQARRRFAALWHRVLLFLTLGHVRALGIPTIAPAELRARLGEPGLYLFDSNRVTLWRQGHVPGAIHVGQEELAPRLLPPDRGASLVFYCRDTR